VGNIPVETQTDLTSGPFMRSDKGPVMIKRKKPIVAYPVNEDQTSLNVILSRRSERLAEIQRKKEEDNTFV
jgi:hypothetical protein